MPAFGSSRLFKIDHLDRPAQISPRQNGSSASLYLLDRAVAAQLTALSGRLILPEIVLFMLSEILLTIRKNDTHGLADLRVGAAFHAEHVFQERFNAAVHRIGHQLRGE
jgi:hypothetical protein